MVTGSSDLSAKNFGMERLAPHDQHCDMADEYMDICKQLLGSCEPGVIIANRESGVLIDSAKVHTIDYVGQYYSRRGPLNSGPCLQEQPVIAQAGGSDRGRRFAAKHADTIVAHVKGVDKMKEYRDDVRAKMAAVGRDPDSCKVLFLVSPILAEPTEEAQTKAAQRVVDAEKSIDRRLAQIGWSTNIDFSTFDLDQPVGELTTNGINRAWRSTCARRGLGRCVRRSSATPVGVRRSTWWDHPMRWPRRWRRRWRRSAGMVFCSRCRMRRGGRRRRSPMDWRRRCSSAG
jgi:alkanesulfonate monooxygenase SsuD/methylene tetrahydromethanopterin reductase-like flavin-dependent oxidoreductase (luciferase family)